MNRFKLYASLLGVGVLAVAACRGDDDDTPGNTPRMGSTGVAGSTNAGSGTGGTTTGGNNSGGTAGTPGGSGAGGSGGGAPPLEITAAQLSNANDPMTAPVNRLVALRGLVATSQKFVLVKSSMGSCLWAVYATTPGAETQPYGSIVITSYGEKAVSGGSGTVCPTAPGQSSELPDDIAPGDLIDVTGFVNEFKSSACGSGQNPGLAFPQRQLGSSRITIKAKGGGTIPPPKEFTTVADINKLADQSNPDDINRQWQYSLVRIAPPTPPGPLTINTAGIPAGGTCAQNFGALKFNDILLSVNNDIYFNDITNGGPGVSGGPKVFSYTKEATINSFTGIYAVDFCTWAVSIRGATEADIQPPPPAAACMPPPPPPQD